MSTPTLILGNNKWAIEEDSILGYAVEDRNGSYLPREISFTRGSDATFTDSTGVIRQACWNLVQQSETFDNGIWTKTAASISSNVTTAPNGTLTADALIEDTSNGLHICGQSITLNSSICTVSIYAKANGRNWMFISMVSASNYGTYFDLQNGVLGTVESNVTATITSVGDGWYRCTLTTTSAVSSARCQVYTATANGVNSYTGNGTSGLFLWGAQLVQGSDALGYLRTTNRLDVPRVDSSTGTKAFLLEPQRTNTMLYSQAINSWAAKTEITITDNYATSPDGTQNASYIQQTTGGNAVTFQSQNINITTGQPQTVSFYAKAKEVTSITLRLGTTAMWSGSIRPSFTCNLLTGAISVGGGTATVSSQSVGDGWYRFIVTTPATISSGTSSLQTPTGTVFSSTTGDGFYLWGVQWEQNASYPTTYIPTQATTVTRIADSFSRSNIYTNGYIGQNGGTWFVELRNNISYVRDGISRFGIGDTSAINLNSLHIGSLSSTTTRQQIYKTVAGSYFLLYTTLTDTVKIAIKWNGTSADVFVNGTKEVSATSFTTTNMEFLKDAGGLTAPTFIQQIKLYSEPLSDAECTLITTL